MSAFTIVITDSKIAFLTCVPLLRVERQAKQRLQRLSAADLLEMKHLVQDPPPVLQTQICLRWEVRTLPAPQIYSPMQNTLRQESSKHVGYCFSGETNKQKLLQAVCHFFLCFVIFIFNSGLCPTYSYRVRNL